MLPDVMQLSWSVWKIPPPEDIFVEDHEGVWRIPPPEDKLAMSLSQRSYIAEHVKIACAPLINPETRCQVGSTLVKVEKPKNDPGGWVTSLSRLPVCDVGSAPYLEKGLQQLGGMQLPTGYELDVGCSIEEVLQDVQVLAEDQVLAEIQVL